MKHEEFMKIVKEHNKRKMNSYKDEPKSVRIRKQIEKGGHSKEEWLALERELAEYIASNPSEEELKKLDGYEECLIMICNSFKE